MDSTDLTPTATLPDNPSATSMDFASYTGYYSNAPQPTDTYMYRPAICTWETCGMDWSYFNYRPNRSINATFAVLFGISAMLFLIQGVASKKRWLGFTIAMAFGCFIELVGYVGRVLAYKDLYTQGPFLTQIVCLTIAPAFLAAGVYLCLSRIVTTFGQENSRISARAYPRIFVTCDFLSLVLQAAGGGIASFKTQNREDPKLGNNLMIAGLSVQVVTLLVFILLALDFAVRTVRRVHQLGAQNALDPQHAALRQSWAFKGFLVALLLSTLLIFTRCVFRVAELSDGWQGHLMRVQRYFIGLEGAVIIAAVLLLNLFHPGFCFRESVGSYAEPEGARKTTWYGRKLDASSQHGSMVELKAREDGATRGA